MASVHFRKSHLFWLIPLILLLLPIAALLASPLFGVHWQGIGWRQGLTLNTLWYTDNGCRLAEVHGARLTALRPVTLTLDSVGINDCPASGEPFALPDLPALDVTVWALQYQDYPPLLAYLSQAEGDWRARTEFRDSVLQAEYRQSNGHWRVDGTLRAAPLRQGLTGHADIQGGGQWRPGEVFQGELELLGHDLGLEDQAARADLTARARWSDQDWQLRAALDQPLALGGGWVLDAGQDLSAAGDGLALRQADVRLVAHGPQGRAALDLSSHDARRGQGRLAFSEGLDGEVTFQWREHGITVAPFQVRAVDPAVALSLREAVTVPLATEGELMLPLEVAYQSATLSTTDSRLSWRSSGVQWHGAVTVGGHWQGYRLSGGWRGDAGPAGVHGEPFRLGLRGNDLDATVTVPVAGVEPPAWPISARLEGHYQGIPFLASVDARLDDRIWSGRIDGRGGPLPDLQGGVLTLEGRWDYAEQPRLLAGASARLTRAVRGTLLVRPVVARLATPLVLAEDGPHGRLTLEAEGLVAERWTLPPVSGAARLIGSTFSADLSVPQWEAVLNLDGHARDGGYAGTLSAATPLAPAMSGGLPMNLQGGELALDGDWRWHDRLMLDGRLRGRDLALDWGSIEARDLNADLSLGWDGERVDLRTQQPLTLASLDVGVPITDIRMELESDSSTWTVRRVHAELLGGELRAPRLTWPSSGWQPVVLTHIELEQLAALQNEPVVALTGRMGGYVPLRLQADSVAVQGGRLVNETPLSLAIPPSGGAQAMAQSNQAVSIALDALNPLRIDTFRAGVDMTADGWLDASITIHGNNPQRNDLPVVFNYTHRENVLELLRSLRIGDEITDQILMESKR